MSDDEMPDHPGRARREVGLGKLDRAGHAPSIASSAPASALRGSGFMGASRCRDVEAAGAKDEACHVLQPVAGFEIGEQEGPLAVHHGRVAVPDAEIGADQVREVGLVDDQEVRAGNPRAPLAGNLVARRHLLDGGEALVRN